MTTAIATSPSIAYVIRLVQRSRLDLSSEKHLQRVGRESCEILEKAA